MFNTVRDIYGNKTNLKITYKDIFAAPPYVLTESELQYLSNIKGLEKKYKRQIVDFLNNSDASMQVLDHILNESENEADIKHHVKEISIPNSINTTTVLTLIYLILARFFHDRNFIVSLYSSDEEIPLGLQDLLEKCSSQGKVDTFFLDQNMLTEKMGRTADRYYDPLSFLKNVAQYAKNTKIFIDYDLQSEIDGLALAKRLHEDGFIYLYLFSGTDFKKEDVPDYLEIIPKNGFDGIDKIISLLD